MLKKTVKYVDFDGNERTEDLYFNLTQTELTEMSVMKNEGLDVYIKKIIESKDSKEILDTFQTIILMAYGEKSEDGKAFRKKKNGVRLADEFEQTAAYDALFVELATNEKSAAEFFNGIIPKQANA